MATQDVKAAEARFQAGIEALQDGKLDVAKEAFSDAEIRFRLVGDFKRAGDSRVLIADAQRQGAHEWAIRPVFSLVYRISGCSIGHPHAG